MYKLYFRNIEILYSILGLDIILLKMLVIVLSK